MAEYKLIVHPEELKQLIAEEMKFFNQELPDKKDLEDNIVAFRQNLQGPSY